MDGELFLLEGEYDDEPLVGMTCFEELHIDHKEDEYLIEVQE